MSKRLSVKQAKMLHKHRYILKKLAAVSIKDRRKIVKNAPNDLFKVLNLIFKLLQDDNLTLPVTAEKSIKKHKRFIRSASRHDSVNTIKSQLSRQRGGSFQKVLATVLPIISAIVKTIL